MLEFLAILTYGGIELWSKQWNKLRGFPVATFVKDILLEERTGDGEHLTESYRIQWSIDKEASLIVVGVYQRFLQLSYVQELLDQLRDKFTGKFGRTTTDYYGQLDGPIEAEFTPVFNSLYQQFETREQQCVQVGKAEVSNRLKAEQDAAKAGDGADSSPTGSPTSATVEGDFIIVKGKKIAKRGGAATLPGSPTGKKPAPEAKKGKPVKEARKWDDAPVTGAMGNEEGGALRKADGMSGAEMDQAVERLKAQSIKRSADGKEARVEETNWEEKEDASQTARRGRIATWLRKTGIAVRELDEQDFAAAMPRLREKLVEKNVAVEIADMLCNSVATSLKGSKIGRFSSLEGAIEEGMTDAIRRILTPKTEINILRDIQRVQTTQHRPYTIVVCGVNGVGKSTSLSKITYWLMQNGHSALIAACDTFRNGAVEQLAVHCRCLGVPLYEQGYGGDASAVAGLAIKQGAKERKHVVMIDTAGRMEDHESRMKALARLIHDNTPDLVLFVGEALVGNTGVTQLRKFNQCLRDYAPVGTTPRGIDGIVLTKFDTIDDKVGAALSMVYELGQPIVFVGVGQTYQDLKKITPEVVVSALMK